MTGDSRLRESIRTLYPGYFALVMATGIISNGFYLLDFKVLSAVMIVIAVGAFLVLATATIARALLFPRELAADLVDPRFVFSFFTLVAGVNVLGIQLFMRGKLTPAIILWIFSIVVWVPLSYLSFAVVTFRDSRQGGGVMNGGWLIAIVGTQSLVVLGTRIAPTLGGWTDAMMLATHMLWGLGLALYGIFITLFCYRIFFLALRPQDVGPLLWVVMGAAAISANAGTSLILSEPRLPFLLAQRPFIDGVTMLLWTWATWWIPMLVVFGLWKHVVHRLPLRYEPAMWSLVFPLGMYSVASARLGLAAEFPTLAWIAGRMIWVAFAAWLIVLSGLARRLARRARHV